MHLLPSSQQKNMTTFFFGAGGGGGGSKIDKVVALRLGVHYMFNSKN